ncbi:hypothetical protein ACICHK_40205 [Streptomyces sp. AHU1]|uniref:hypothetical protein n=1 Tax=Streptomyces sp. AHU1 TaxID=3377215 RepID=UPI00387822F7
MAAHLFWFAVQVDRGGRQPCGGEEADLFTVARTTAVDGQAVPAQIVHRSTVGSGTGFLLLRPGRLGRVPVGQTRQRQPLDLIGRRHLQHPKNASADGRNSPGPAQQPKHRVRPGRAPKA